jgi:hypothetical protein
MSETKQQLELKEQIRLIVINMTQDDELQELLWQYRSTKPNKDQRDEFNDTIVIDTFNGLINAVLDDNTGEEAEE